MQAMDRTVHMGHTVHIVPVATAQVTEAIVAMKATKVEMGIAATEVIVTTVITAAIAIIVAVTAIVAGTSAVSQVALVLAVAVER